MSTSPTSHLHERLVELLHDRSVRYGEFTLASGRTSDFYVDARQTTLHAEGAWLVGELIHTRLRPEVTGIGGPSLGGDPVATAAAIASYTHGHPVHAFLIRKAPKGHGTGAWIEGLANIPRGSPVAIAEDTTTTGGSLLRAVARARDAGLDVVQCFTVVDRQEGAIEALAAADLTLEPLVTRTQLEARR